MAEEKYFAHSCNLRNVGHIFRDHLKGVACKIEAFNPDPDFLSMFRVACLLHDFGRYQSSFQKYLKDGGHRGSVSCFGCGAFFALRYKLFEASFAIDGHHNGLPKKVDFHGYYSKNRGSRHTLSDFFE